MQRWTIPGGVIVATGLVLVLCSSCCHVSGQRGAENTSARYCWIIELKADEVAAYRALRETEWPKVLEKIKAFQMCNYSNELVELNSGGYRLMSFIDYTGRDFNADMKRMVDDPTAQGWWTIAKPQQISEKPEVAFEVIYVD